MIYIIYKKVIEGTICTPETVDKIGCYGNALVCVNQQGLIASVLFPNNSQYGEIKQTAISQGNYHQLAADEYLLPGYVDLHVHAPQWPQAGLSLDLPLADWLDHYTFPLESKCSDLNYSKMIYDSLVKELLSQGTTTALMFGTIYNDSNIILAKACLEYGLRGFIGQVAMDNADQTPAYYRNQSAKDAVDATELFIKQLQNLSSDADRVVPVITPRFVPSCSDACLQGLGQLANKYHVPVQTHVSESSWEHGYVLDRFKATDTSVLDQFGLLTDRTILMHATHLTDDDMILLAKRKAALAHCPISNAYFGNGVMRVKEILAKQIKLGLGTDISGGYSSSIYHNIRQAVISSRMLEDGVDTTKQATTRGVANSRINIATAFYMATVGGAEALHLNTGRIKEGYKADFQVVKSHPSVITLSDEQMIERILYQTQQSDIKQVYIDGNLVYCKD